MIAYDSTHCHTHQALVQVVALVVVVSPGEEEDHEDVICCILVELAEVTPVITLVIITCFDGRVLVLQVVGVA